MSYWSNESSSVVTEVRKRNVVPMQPIERARYDELMAEQQLGVGSHPKDCGCDYCTPLGVSRSATFEVAQRALRPEEQPQEAEERPRLTLRVER